MTPRGGSPIRWLILTLGIVFNVTANISVKAAVRGVAGGLTARTALRLLLAPYFLLGVVSFGLALLFYSYALTSLDLSIAYPIMTSLGLVLVFALSVAFFGESLAWPKLLGTALILAGVFLVARGN